ncbi:MAG TPA: EVE domain-containing protein [Alloacidobacterium sp.]|jgi:predicted RNA-binding protein with PUA-like domain|nr:EVE domain-containing protein [Alloacidobacterium sp.]
MPYLLKTEPATYSFNDLESEGETIWDGVSNPVALRFLRSMKPGEKLVIYHTGDEKTAVGTAKVVSVDAADPKVPNVRIKAGKPIQTPHTLAEIKAHKLFADSPLVRQGRLSVVPLTDAQYAWLTGE